MNNYQEKQPVARQSLRAFIKARRARVKGFGLLLFYCHMLMVFAFLTRQFLPGMAEIQTLLEAIPSLIAVVGADATAAGLTELGWLALLGRVSSVLVWVMFGLTTLSLFWPVCFKTALWLGLAHVLYAFVLLVRAAWVLSDLPEAAMPGLPEQAQAFAAGGYFYWLAGVLGLVALLWLTRRSARSE
ncbi:MAG: hypothetical protein LBV80_12200 [Deltaproteobacteria bacterium]|jgi:hypothetical protein|nr:hypothetical protein [Deltaproteobacteria bacterium]